MAAIEEILADYKALRSAQEAFYQDLHRHPELSHQEHRTAGRVAERLSDDGFAVTSGIGGTGVVGVLANGSGPAVLLRRELEALPLRGGHRRAVREHRHRHRCQRPPGAGRSRLRPRPAHGRHDRHGHARGRPPRPVARDPDQLFQPAEETGEGAQDMVNDGLFKRIPVPDVALAQHLLPGIAGTVRTRSGPFMSAADSIKVTVYGRGGHGSTPQHTVDPVVLAAMIIIRLQTIVSREVAPGDIAVVTGAAARPAPGATSSPATPSWNSTCAATPA